MIVKLEKLDHEYVLFRVLSDFGAKDFQVTINLNEYESIYLISKERPFKRKLTQNHELSLEALNKNEVTATFEIICGKSRLKRKCNISESTYDAFLKVFEYTRSLYKQGIN
jgi:hypothetical protein